MRGAGYLDQSGSVWDYFWFCSQKLLLVSSGIIWNAGDQIQGWLHTNHMLYLLCYCPDLEVITFNLFNIIRNKILIAWEKPLSPYFIVFITAILLQSTSKMGKASNKDSIAFHYVIFTDLHKFRVVLMLPIMWRTSVGVHIKQKCIYFTF